ncbi:MAG: AbrB/MazE/SpoVT family DNA-binding domain-containing protein [Kangiellaceae bacterium]|nr:AbrB/MazE/SpoVT family DNA-binding domain-containing protein [Kangiellaceae bacterium]
MTSIAVRQSGGANIVSIPKAIIKTLGLQVGSKLDLTIKDNKIVLTPINEELSLDALIEGSPQECFKVMEEDREWIDAVPKGKEV